MRTPSDPQPESAVVLRVGDWRIDRTLGRLIEPDGRAIQPEPKALSLLLILAETPGRPVSRAELKERLWQGDHIAPGALKHLIWQLRQDLGDDAKAPRYVETVRGRGYRLVPDVTVETESTPPVNKPERSRAWIAGAFVLAVLLLVVTRGRQQDSLTPQEPVAPQNPPTRNQPTVRPLTALPGNETGPAIAPDGSFVVFAWDGAEASDVAKTGDTAKPGDTANPGDAARPDDGGGSFDLYRIATSGGTPELLVSTAANEMEPAIAPDGRQLAYVRGGDTGGGAELWLHDLVTGAERRLAETAGSFLDVVWLHTGKHLVVSELSAPGVAARLREIHLEGAARWLTSPPERTPGDVYPAASPDGRWLAFFRRQRGGAGQVLLLELETDELTTLDVAAGRLIGLAFDRSGDGLIVSSDRVPPRGLWRLPLLGGEPQWLGLPGSFVAEPTSSLNGSVAYQDQRCDSNIWQVSLAGGNETPAKTPVASLISTRQDMHAELSADGGSVALLSNRDGAHQIWIALWPDGNPRQLATEGGPVLALAWAPDGQRLAFATREASGISAVHTIAIDGAGQTRLSDPTIHNVAPSWSWDGSAIYTSAWIGDSWRIVKHAGDGSWKTDLCAGVSAKEEPGGEVLWVVDAERPGLSRWSAGERIETALPFVSALDAESWQPIAGGVVFLHWGPDGERHLSRWMSESEELRTLAILDRNLPYPPGLSVSPDGQTVLWTRIDAIASDLLLAQSPY